MRLDWLVSQVARRQARLVVRAASQAASGFPRPEHAVEAVAQLLDFKSFIAARLLRRRSLLEEKQ
jgi:hypothetical protein